MSSPSPSPYRALPSRAARRRVGGWLGLAAVVLTLMVGAFGNLPLPAPADADTPFAMVICTVDGVFVLGGQDDAAASMVHGDLCLLCLPLGLGGADAITLFLVVLAVLAVPRRAPCAAVARVILGPSQDFGTARDVRGPPAVAA